jgi:hypothetical protein
VPGDQKPADIVQNFGAPARIAHCGNDEVWLYDQDLSILQ